MIRRAYPSEITVSLQPFRIVCSAVRADGAVESIVLPVLARYLELDAAELGAQISSGLKELRHSTAMPLARVRLVMPPGWCLETIICLDQPRMRPEQVEARVRVSLGPGFTDRSTTRVAWFAVSDKRAPESVYASVSSHKHNRLLKRSMQFMGIKRFALHPYSYGAFRLCPSSGDAVAIFDEDDGAMRVVCVTNRLPWRMLLYPIGESRLKCIRSFIESHGRPDNVPLVLYGDWDSLEIRESLRAMGFSLCTETATPSFDYPIDHSRNQQPNRVAPGLVALGVTLLVTQACVLQHWDRAGRERLMATHVQAKEIARALDSTGQPKTAQAAPAEVHTRGDPGFWLAVREHIASVKTSALVSQVRASDPDTASGRFLRGDVLLHLSGTGDLDEILYLLRGLQKPPVVATWLVSLERQGATFKFEMRACWRQ